jgi:hypothetical protein
MFWHFDFYDGTRQRRDLRARPRHPVPGRADQAEEHPRHRQDRFHQSPDAGALQVPESQHQGDAEDVHPVADGDALPLEPGAVDKKFYPDRDAIYPICPRPTARR